MAEVILSRIRTLGFQETATAGSPIALTSECPVELTGLGVNISLSSLMDDAWRAGGEALRDSLPTTMLAFEVAGTALRTEWFTPGPPLGPQDASFWGGERLVGGALFVDGQKLLLVPGVSVALIPVRKSVPDGLPLAFAQCDLLGEVAS